MFLSRPLALRVGTRNALSTMFLSLAFSACAAIGSSRPAAPAMPGSVSLKPSDKLTVLYRFATQNEGRHPMADVSLLGGTLYGTTTQGGTGRHMCYCGVVYAIDASNNERTLHIFKGDSKKNPPQSDGATPLGGLVLFKGKMYGTTSAGGDGGPSGPCTGVYPRTGCGSVYTIDSTGAVHIIYRFQGGADGVGPIGNLVPFHNKLYGVTQYGGDGNTYYCQGTCGTIFSITESGKEKIVHSFSTLTDGKLPQAGLSDIGGKLYGTTSDGGSSVQCGECGTVYSLDANNNFTTLYSFTGKYDGGEPESTLVGVGGKIYGTTYTGGNRGLCGTLFSIDSAGHQNTVWMFCNSRGDGAHPSGSLALINGIIYGTTQEGGAHACAFGRGCGTIFSFDPQTNIETPIASPTSQDGRQPFGITAANGILYGAMYEGGGGGGRGGTNGTVYSVTP